MKPSSSLLLGTVSGLNWTQLENCHGAAHPQLVIPTGSKSSISLPRVHWKKTHDKKWNLASAAWGLCICPVPPDFPRNGPGHILLLFRELSHQTIALPQQSLHSCSIVKKKKKGNRNHNPLEFFRSVFLEHFLSIYSKLNPVQTHAQSLSKGALSLWKTHRLAAVT